MKRVAMSLAPAPANMTKSYRTWNCVPVSQSTRTFSSAAEPDFSNGRTRVQILLPHGPILRIHITHRLLPLVDVYSDI